jgi:DNA-dependent metalloprotease WSS1
MLHELTHNVRGPHDALFYEKLDELTAECEELITKGIVGSGQGFDALSAGRIGGRRLVGDDNSSSNSRIHGIESNNGSEQQQQQQQQRQPAKHILREAMMKAAEARARQASLMPTGPRKVGGNPTLKNIMTAREAAVYAAERRLRDNVWCPTEEGLCLEEEDEEDREGGGGSGNGNGVNVALQKVLDRDEGIKREKNDKKRILRKGTEKIREKEEEVVVLIDSDDDDGGGGGRQVGESSKKKRSLEASGWACVVCTLVNEPLVLQCMACLTERPPHVCKN